MPVSPTGHGLLSGAEQDGLAAARREAGGSLTAVTVIRRSAARWCRRRRWRCRRRRPRGRERDASALRRWPPACRSACPSTRPRAARRTAPRAGCRTPNDTRLAGSRSAGPGEIAGRPAPGPSAAPSPQDRLVGARREATARGWGARIVIVKRLRRAGVDAAAAVPPSSTARTVTVATPVAPGAGVKVSVPVGDERGLRAERAPGVSLATRKDTVWPLSGGPGVTPVAQPATLCGAGVLQDRLVGARCEAGASLTAVTGDREGLRRARVGSAEGAAAVVDCSAHGDRGACRGLSAAGVKVSVPAGDDRGLRAEQRRGRRWRHAKVTAWPASSTARERCPSPSPAASAGRRPRAGAGRRPPRRRARR